MHVGVFKESVKGKNRNKQQQQYSKETRKTVKSAYSESAQLLT